MPRMLDMTAKGLTTISIRRTVWQELRNLGKTGDTYNDVIMRLLAKAKQTEESK